MKFIIENEIFRIFPDLRIAVVLGRGLQIRKRTQELETLIGDNMKKLYQKIEKVKLENLTNINSWREVYRQLGVNYKNYMPAVEKLVRQVIKDNNFPFINTAVDAYLAVELLTLLPINGFDLAAVDGDIQLRVSRGGEFFKPLGGGDMELTTPREIVYSDIKTILSRGWNCRNCEGAKITENSTSIILTSEAALADISTRDLIETLYKIVEYESAFCQGIYSTFILDIFNPEVELQ